MGITENISIGKTKILNRISLILVWKCRLRTTEVNRPFSLWLRKMTKISYNNFMKLCLYVNVLKRKLIIILAKLIQ